MDRTILHCDCNAYFASVECIAQPALKAVPMAVCGDPRSRHGIILAKNERAKAYGVRTAETIWEAKRKCPGLVLVAPHHDKYAAYCERINAIYLQYTDRVERFSVDESWLDVTGSLRLCGDGPAIADELRRRIREEIGLTISVGVSFNKTFAKLGSDYQKPDATTVITRENYRALLWPLPAHDMLFVGKAAEETLQNAGVRTIGDIAESPRARLSALLGKGGESIWEHANGIDEEPVKRFDEADPVKSVGNSITFARDLVGMRDIRAGLTMLCDSVATRLRRQGLYCATVQVQIKDPQLRTIQRQCRLDPADNATRAIFDAAMSLVCRAWPADAPIRLLGVTAASLSDTAAEQLTLLGGDPAARDKSARLDRTVDAIRARYGKRAIAFANTVDTDIVRGPDETD